MAAGKIENSATTCYKCDLKTTHKDSRIVGYTSSPYNWFFNVPRSIYEVKLDFQTFPNTHLLEGGPSIYIYIYIYIYCFTIRDDMIALLSPMIRSGGKNTCVVFADVF